MFHPIINTILIGGGVVFSVAIFASLLESWKDNYKK